MANEFFGLALANPGALKMLAENPNLDNRVRKVVEQIHRELMAIFYRTSEAQDALSLTYLYTKWKTQATLTEIEMMKVSRSSIAPAAELDKLDKTLRKRYIEQMNQIAHAGSLEIVEKSK